MLYLYKCDSCDKVEEIVKPARESSSPEVCKCGVEMRKLFTPPQLMAISSEDPFRSVALGQIVKNKKHERALAKERGWEEVGNEIQSKHLKPELKKYPTLGELGIV